MSTHFYQPLSNDRKVLWLRAVMRSAELSGSAKLVAYCLQDHHNSATGRLDLAVGTIAAEMDLSDRSVQNGIADLVRTGFLSRLHRRSPVNGQPCRSSMYRLIECRNLPGTGEKSDVQPPADFAPKLPNRTNEANLAHPREPRLPGLPEGREADGGEPPDLLQWAGLSAGEDCEPGYLDALDEGWEDTAAAAGAAGLTEAARAAELSERPRISRPSPDPYSNPDGLAAGSGSSRLGRRAEGKIGASPDRDSLLRYFHQQGSDGRAFLRHGLRHLQSVTVRQSGTMVLTIEADGNFRFLRDYLGGICSGKLMIAAKALGWSVDGIEVVEAGRT